jgi:hypothetical protein
MSTIKAGTTTGTALVTEGDTTGQLVFQTNGTTTALTIGTNQTATFSGNVAVNGTLTASGGLPSLATPLAVVGDATAGSEIRLPEDTDNGSNYVALKAPNALAANLTLTLPTADGTNGQVLQTNGSGALAFANIAVANGGTGATTLTANAVLIGNGTSAVSSVAPGTNGNVLTSNGTTWTSAAASPAGLQGVMVVLTSGTSYTIPAGVTKIKATVVGGGGGISGQFFNNTGGGGGGTAIKYFTVTPGASITYAVGAAGTSGVNGGDSSVTVGGTTVTGGGGVAGSTNGTAIFSPGGSATNGDLNITGSGGGGSNAGITFGGSSLFGRGGMSNSNSNTTPSVGYGSGGTYLNTSVQPTAGVVIIEY